MPEWRHRRAARRRGAASGASAGEGSARGRLVRGSLGVIDSTGRYIARSCLPRRKIMRGVKPPLRLSIQLRTAGGYIEIQHAGRFGIGHGRGRAAPKSQAAWKPRLAREVTQIRSWGTAPRTMVQGRRAQAIDDDGFARGAQALDTCRHRFRSGRRDHRLSVTTACDLPPLLPAGEPQQSNPVSSFISALAPVENCESESDRLVMQDTDVSVSFETRDFVQTAKAVKSNSNQVLRARAAPFFAEEVPKAGTAPHPHRGRHRHWQTPFAR